MTLGDPDAQDASSEGAPNITGGSPFNRGAAAPFSIAYPQTKSPALGRAKEKNGHPNNDPTVTLVPPEGLASGKQATRGEGSRTADGVAVNSAVSPHPAPPLTGA
jgi:hypothetical protein